MARAGASRAGRASAQAREARRLAEPGPLRETRTARITIEDTHRPRTVLTISREQDDEGRWMRWRVAGHALPPLGRTGLARILAQYLD
jgi:hypothetical protein